MGLRRGLASAIAMSASAVLVLMAGAGPARAQGPVHTPATDQAAAELRARIEASPRLPFTPTEFRAKPPTAGWESGMVSWVALDGAGHLYEARR